MTFEEALNILKQTSPLKITVSGDLGAGKSTFAKHLSEELEVPRIYAGGLLREKAAERGMTLAELGASMENDKELDLWVDSVTTKRSEELERGIFEGRTAWHFVKNPTARLFFSVDDRIAAERIWGDKNNPNRDKYTSIEHVIEANNARRTSEIKRYKQYYDIDVYDHKNFDIIIDTSKISLEDVYKQAIIALAEHIQS